MSSSHASASPRRLGLPQTALVLRRDKPEPLAREAASSWLIYLRQKDGEDIMIHVTKHAYLETCDSVLESFRGHGDVYAVPV